MLEPWLGCPGLEVRLQGVRVVHLMSECRFDMKMDHKLRAVSMTLQTAGDFVVAFTSSAAATAPGGGDPEAVALLGTLWVQKMHNRQLSLEAELSSHVRPDARSVLPVAPRRAQRPSGAIPHALLGIHCNVTVLHRTANHWPVNGRPCSPIS